MLLGYRRFRVDLLRILSEDSLSGIERACESLSCHALRLRRLDAASTFCRSGVTDILFLICSQMLISTSIRIIRQDMSSDRHGIGRTMSPRGSV